MSRIVSLIAAFLLVIAVAVVYTNAKGASRSPIPAATDDVPLAQTPGKATAVFAGGCFWGTQSVFERVKGVLDTTVGYSGGAAETATYAQVGTERTGHAESVKVVYDPSKSPTASSCASFLRRPRPHPAQPPGARRGDLVPVGHFYETDEQMNIAQAYIAQLDAAHIFPCRHRHPGRATERLLHRRGVPPALRRSNPNQPYILVCDRPKIAALKQQFPDLFQDYKEK